MTIDPAGPDVPLTIEASGASASRQYVEAARLGSRPLNRAWLYDSEWRRRRTLTLEMGNKAGASWGTGPRSLPPSLSDSRLARFGCAPER